jgi:4-hydroxybenzoate polyprenyltransferase
MTKRILQSLGVLAVLALYVGTALAADAPPSPDADAAGWIKALYEAVTSKNWGLVAGVVLIGLVYPLRRFGPSIFKTGFGGIVLAFLTSLAGTFGIALAAGAKPNLAMIVTAVTTAATAAGLWQWIKDHIPGMQEVADKAVEKKAS